MDLPSYLSELRLDERVHVLGAGIDGLESTERLAHIRELSVIEDAGRVQPLGVEQRALHVIGQQLRVVGLEELPDLWRKLGTHASRPERHSAGSSGT